MLELVTVSLSVWEKMKEKKKEQLSSVPMLERIDGLVVLDGCLMGFSLGNI